MKPGANLSRDFWTIAIVIASAFIPAARIHSQGAGPPKVLITNEQNFSAAETFAFMFKVTKTGTIVGTRTGGGGIGAALFQPGLIDGGRIAIPNRAAYNPSGSWDIENNGVVPDIAVEFLPRDFRDGRDPQLEKGV